MPIAALRFCWVAATLAWALSCAPSSSSDNDADSDDIDEQSSEPSPDIDTCDLPTNKPSMLAPAIYHGTREPSLLPLDAAAQNAVVALADIFEPYTTAGSFCSGTLIAPNVVLTAQHCTDGYANAEMVVLVGRDEYAPIAAFRSVEILEDARLDIALVFVAEDIPSQVDVRPIAPALLPPRAELVGGLVELSGFGETDDGSEGRYFVTEIYEGVVDGDHLRVNGQGERGVCFGDSGGPLLQIDEGGDVRVYGVLSYGDDPCGATDYYQRVDVFADTIIDRVGDISPLAAPCGIYDDVGRCNRAGNVAAYCQASVLQVQACRSDEHCVEADDDASHVRCVDTSEDPCAGVTRYGLCGGDRLLWCNDGERVTRDCAACGEVCRFIDDESGFACVPSSCGDVTEEGRCEGDVAVTCADGINRVDEDCTATGLTCDYVGGFLGHGCYDAVACEGVRYFGECDGTVVRWCEANTLHTYDCANDDQVCGLADPERGNNCIDASD